MNIRPQLPPLTPKKVALSSDDSDEDDGEEEIMMIQLIQNLQHAKAQALEEKQVIEKLNAYFILLSETDQRTNHSRIHIRISN